MEWTPPLIKSNLLRRYKRFLADVSGDSLEGELVVHCANPGSMKGLLEPQCEAWISDSCNPKRKLRYSLELLRLASGAMVCVNTSRANRIVAEALSEGLIKELREHSHKAEVKWSGEEETRFDFKLTPLQDVQGDSTQGDSTQGDSKKPSVYLEVKSVTYLLREGVAGFPDSVTSRGQKHLRSLMEVVKSGQRACLLFCVNRTDVNAVSPAELIDPVYAQLLREAVQVGVEVDGRDV